jgi:hypothetical protein
MYVEDDYPVTEGNVPFGTDPYISGPAPLFYDSVNSRLVAKITGVYQISSVVTSAGAIRSGNNTLLNLTQDLEWKYDYSTDQANRVMQMSIIALKFGDYLHLQSPYVANETPGTVRMAISMMDGNIQIEAPIYPTSNALRSMQSDLANMRSAIERLTLRSVKAQSTTLISRDLNGNLPILPYWRDNDKLLPSIQEEKKDSIEPEHVNQGWLESDAVASNVSSIPCTIADSSFNFSDDSDTA